MKFRRNTVGVDINEDNVAYSNYSGSQAKIIQAGHIDFNDEIFYGIIIDNALEHIIDPSESIKEITRVVKKRGHLLIGVPGVKGFNSDIDHNVFYNEESLGSLMKQWDYEHLNTIHPPFLIGLDYLSNHLKIYCIYIVYKKYEIKE